jgi:uncharacterized protein YjbI with pentapeptide repeats
MDWIVTKAPDSTYDTESRSELPRSLPGKPTAEIGDSITIRGNGDRIKVTLLGVVDPAVIKSRGISGMMAMLRGEEPARQDFRCVAVRLRMRNLEDEGKQGVLQGICGGVLFDSDGREYFSTGESVENCPALWAPNRGEQPKVMCDAFEIPQGAKPARYVLAISRGERVPAGEWNLKRSRPASSESETDLGVREQRQVLEAGVDAWNAWRAKNPRVEVQLASEKLNGRDLKGINLSGANLERANFSGSDLTNANFSKAHACSALFPKARVASANFGNCDLRDASFFEAYAAGANFDRAVMTKANLEKMQAYAARFREADLRGVRGIEAGLMDCNFEGAKLEDVNFTGALLGGAAMSGVNLCGSKLTGAYLQGADLRSVIIEDVSAYGANLQGADLTGATVSNSDLSLATLVNAKLGDAIIVNTRVFGVSAWNIEGTPKRQDEIVITPQDQARVTVTDLEVANFVYLLLNNEKIRNAIETIGGKGVLILGRFTERKHVLEAIKKEIGRLDLLPIVFDFERPTNHDFTETVMTLAGMSRFIVADITAPRSVPLELQATVPNYMVPLVPLLAEGERPFSMFEDLWKKHRDWVLEPLSYESVEQLIRVFKKAVVDPANERLEFLRVRKAEKLLGRHASDYEDGAPRDS